MFALFKSRTFLVVLGFVLLALFVWYAGPYFAFADRNPLETPTARVIAIGLIVVLWMASVVLKRMRANRASDQLVAAVVKQSHAEERPSAEAIQLRERFEEAVATLKQKRRGGHSLYDLPWYVIIGAPGSGKTTALVNSGLNFPLEQRSGKGALRGVGGTRNCDWWFTDEAVFLDTAGRYTTQDSDASADSAGWAEFLALLRKYRKRRPVNGIILTISAHDLLVQGQGGREAHVTAARRRLNELNKELRIQLPVYLMVTKCDLVSGFTEFFDDLAQDGRAQVWGVTFPYEQTRSGTATQSFTAEFDALISRLNTRVFARLEEDRDVRRRTKVFAFPQQVAALRDLLAGFVSDVFASTRFDQQTLLRGVYFTSGTQEGTPIDRLLTAIGRRFAVAPEAVAPHGRGKAYFIERLLKDVLLAESGLAGVNRRLEVQKGALQLGAYAAMVLIAVLGIIAFSVSYSSNRQYVANVATDLAMLTQVPPVAPGGPLERLLPRLDAVRTVVQSADRNRADVPWSMRWGLYQGTAIGNAARDAYSRELDGALLPRVAGRFRQRLLDYSSEPEKLYEYLKAYLMLGDSEHLNKNHLGYLAQIEWASAYAADPDASASVTRHFQSLLDYEGKLRPVTLDQSLISQARSTIQQASIPKLVYSQLKLGYANDSARALRLDVAAGIGADQVFKRKSGASFSEPLPSLYTRAVFAEVTGKSTDELVKQFAADSWVWGEAKLTPVGSNQLAAQVTDIYEKEYIAKWDEVLRDIGLPPLSNLNETSSVLRTLSGPTSPLRGLLKTVDTHTFLVAPPDAAKPAGGRLSSVKERLGTIFEEGKKAVGLAAAPPGTQITTHFAPIHQLISGEPGNAPLDRVLAQIGQIQQALAAVGTGLGDVSPIEALTQRGSGGLLESLRQDAKTLPSPVDGLVAEIGGRAGTVTIASASRELGNRYQQDVARECREIISDRYPFAIGSQTDVPLADFGRLFGYNGVFDSFFKNNLEKLVDTSRSPWTWRAGESGESVGASLAMLRQFEAAEQIREMFFTSGSQMPEVRFTVTLANLDAQALRFILEIDGKRFENRHEAERSLPATWPGPNPGTAVATFEDNTSRRPNIAYEGAWAWFRLVEAGRPQRETDVRSQLKIQTGGHEVSVRVEAASVRNPFGKRDLQQFRCGL